MPRIQSTILPAIALLCLLSTASALKCFFQTMPDPDDTTNTQEKNNKEYECKQGDKYCVDFGGELRNPIKNISLALRSCEGDVKRYLDPISTKIGEKIIFDCANSDGKKHEIGPLTYWYNCCTTDDCNNAAISSFNMVLLVQMVSSCVILSLLSSIAA